MVVGVVVVGGGFGGWVVLVRVVVVGVWRVRWWWLEW